MLQVSPLMYMPVEQRPFSLFPSLVSIHVAAGGDDRLRGDVVLIRVMTDEMPIRLGRPHWNLV